MMEPGSESIIYRSLMENRLQRTSNGTPNVEIRLWQQSWNRQRLFSHLICLIGQQMRKELFARPSQSRIQASQNFVRPISEFTPVKFGMKNRVGLVRCDQFGELPAME